MIRYLLSNGTVYAVLDGQRTQDEKDTLIVEYQEFLDSINGDDEGYKEALSVLESAKAIIACAPAGAVELTSEEVEALRNPPKTFEQELADLNAKYDSDFDALVKEYNRAVARDSVVEGVKVSVVRAKMIALDTEYDDAVMALTLNQS